MQSICSKSFIVRMPNVHRNIVIISIYAIIELYEHIGILKQSEQKAMFNGMAVGAT